MTHLCTGGNHGNTGLEDAGPSRNKTTARALPSENRLDQRGPTTPVSLFPDTHVTSSRSPVNARVGVVLVLGSAPDAGLSGSHSPTSSHLWCPRPGNRWDQKGPHTWCPNQGLSDTPIHHVHLCSPVEAPTCALGISVSL